MGLCMCVCGEEEAKGPAELKENHKLLIFLLWLKAVSNQVMQWLFV